MPLTRTQITHAQKRIEQAKTAYINAKLAALGEKPKVGDYTHAEKLAFIRSGQATLTTDAENLRHNYNTVVNQFTYPVLGTHVEQQAAYDAWDKACDAVRAEAQGIEDELIDQLIMSPDGSAALARIAEAFAA